MNARQRGALWLVGALVLGRVLDALDLPFERSDATTPAVVRLPDATARPTAVPESAAVRIAADRTPALPEAPRAPARATPAAADTTPVAINSATADELQRLPGVGPVLAGRIVAERLAGGPFRTPEDLRRVRGIGAKTGARLASRLRFD